MSLSFDFGREAENFAVDYFSALGYQVLARNYFFQKAEIDLILQKENEIIMVEVKARNSSFIRPEDAVNQKKKRLLIKAANEFILRNNLEADIRFDILALIKQKDGWKINHIIDAFNALEL